MSSSSASHIVREHGPRVYRLLARLLGPRYEVEDVFQDTMLEIVKGLKSFEGRSSIETWVHRVTLNVAYQEMRGQYRNPDWEVLDEDLVSDSARPSPEDEAQLRELFRTLSEVEPKQRLVVQLHDIEGRTLAEIAQWLGVPLQTVASRLRRGRRTLVRRLAKRGTRTRSSG